MAIERTAEEQQQFDDDVRRIRGDQRADAVFGGDVRARYYNDPVFHRVVDVLRSVISGAQLTPSEVREAAMLACIIEEDYKPRRPFTTGDADLAILRQQVRGEQIARLHPGESDPRD